MWPVEVNHVVVGARLLRRWKTSQGKERFQVREVLSIGPEHAHFVPQMNEDCCAYIVAGGWRSGKEGACARIALSSWADGVQLPDGTIVGKFDTRL